MGILLWYFPYIVFSAAFDMARPQPEKHQPVPVKSAAGAYPRRREDSRGQ
jgi:hypothetical protein